MCISNHFYWERVRRRSAADVSPLVTDTSIGQLSLHPTADPQSFIAHINGNWSNCFADRTQEVNFFCSAASWRSSLWIKKIGTDHHHPPAVSEGIETMRSGFPDPSQDAENVYVTPGKDIERFRKSYQFDPYLAKSELDEHLNAVNNKDGRAAGQIVKDFMDNSPYERSASGCS